MAGAQGLDVGVVELWAAVCDQNGRRAVHPDEFCQSPSHWLAPTVRQRFCHQKSTVDVLDRQDVPRALAGLTGRIADEICVPAPISLPAHNASPGLWVFVGPSEASRRDSAQEGAAELLAPHHFLHVLPEDANALAAQSTVETLSAGESEVFRQGHNGRSGMWVMTIEASASQACSTLD